MSDSQAAGLAAQVGDDADNAIEYAGFDKGQADIYFNQMAVAYQQLIARCGQLVQGQ